MQNCSLTERSRNRRDVLGAAVDVLPSAVLFTACLTAFADFIQLQGFLAAACVPGTLCLLLLKAEGKAGIWVKRVVFAASISLLCFLLLGEFYLRQGLLLTVNQVLMRIACIAETFPNLFETSAVGGEAYTAIGLFWALFGIFPALFIEKMKRNILEKIILIPILLLLGIQIFSGRTGSSLFLFLGILFYWWMSFAEGDRQQKVSGKQEKLAWLQTMIIFLAVLAVSYSIFATLLGGGEYQKSKPVNAVKDAAEKTIQNIRFEKGEVDSLPEGKLKGLGSLKQEEKTALEVLMEQPQSMYLRGYVGSSYTGYGWEELPAETYIEERDLFYWLHQKGFYGTGQLSLLHSLVRPDVSRGKITIQNIGGNSRYLYLPYELNSDPDALEGRQALGDVCRKAEGILGTRLYQFTADTNLVKQYPLLASEFYSRKDETKLKDYAEAESYYNAFVYQHYLELSSEAEALLQIQLSTEHLSGKEHCTYEKANAIVMGYLDSHLTYSEEPDSYQGDQDFLKWLLEKEGKGYAVHYATAAALMYRYLGIPARYVEGYLITPKLVSDVQSYEKVQVTGKESHAWVEIYQDGVGWIPMEVTPKYRDVMERPEYSLAPREKSSDGSVQEGGAKESQEIQDQESEPPKKKTASKPKPSIGKMIVWIAAGAAIILLLWLICRLIRGRYRLYRTKQSFCSSDTREAVIHLYRYIHLLLRYDRIPFPGGSHYGYTSGIEERYGKNIALEYQKTLQCVQACIYGTDEITKEQRDHAAAFKDLLLKKILEKKKLRRKFRMKWIDFIY